MQRNSERANLIKFAASARNLHIRSRSSFECFCWRGEPGARRQSLGEPRPQHPRGPVNAGFLQLPFHERSPNIDPSRRLLRAVDLCLRHFLSAGKSGFPAKAESVGNGFLRGRFQEPWIALGEQTPTADRAERPGLSPPRPLGFPRRPAQLIVSGFRRVLLHFLPAK